MGEESQSNAHHSFLSQTINIITHELALPYQEGLPHFIVSEKEHMGTTFLLPGILTESAMELIGVDSFQSSSHKVLAEFQQSMLILTSIVKRLKLIQLGGKLQLVQCKQEDSSLRPACGQLNQSRLTGQT